eukprot:3132568-Pyramimonas_sp.AAC.1
MSLGTFLGMLQGLVRGTAWHCLALLGMAWHCLAGRGTALHVSALQGSEEPRARDHGTMTNKHRGPRKKDQESEERRPRNQGKP